MVVSSAIDLLCNVAIISLIIWGIAALFTEGMLFEHIGKWMDEAQPSTRWWYKPIILCPTCMTSVWGTAYAWYLDYSPMNWILLVFATAGLNYIIANK